MRRIGIAGKILGCVYITLGCLALSFVALGCVLTEQQRDQLQLFGVSLTLFGLGSALLLSSRDRC